MHPLVLLEAFPVDFLVPLLHALLLSFFSLSV